MNAQKAETASLSKYKKLKYLGKGSYGAALLVCLRSSPAQKFVVKEIVVGHLKPAEQQAAKNEAEVLHQMSHSNITMYIESFVEGSKLYIVMEYADGGDLHAAIKRRVEAKTRFGEDEVMRIFVQICLALKHVHGANILHRDLKSQNIFLTLNGIVKLGDFGIAKVLDATDDNAKTQIGTPYYLSPEICENLPYGQKSDIWSLGVVLFELSALELPFQAASLPALVHRICTVDPPYNKLDKNYSSAMLTMMKTMLNRTVDARPSVKDLVKSGYIKGHICELLSFTLKAGTGGGEGALDTTITKQQRQLQAQESLNEMMDDDNNDDNDDISIGHDPEDANRRAAKERHDAIQQARKDKLRKFKKEQAAQAKKNDSNSNIVVSARSQFDDDDDDESVSTFMTKNESPRLAPKLAPVVVPGSNKQSYQPPPQQQQQQQQQQQYRQPAVNQSPPQQYRQPVNQQVDQVKQQMYNDHQNVQRAQQQQQQYHQNSRSDGNDSVVSKQYQPIQQESAARKEFFANRAAAEQFKARAGYGGRPAPTANSPAPYMADDNNNGQAYNNYNNNNRPQSNGQQQQQSQYSGRSASSSSGPHAGRSNEVSASRQGGGIDPNDLKNMDPETRIAALKAMRERERVQELQEQEHQLQLAREATREAQHQLKINQQKRLDREKQEESEREVYLQQQAEQEQLEYEQRQKRISDDELKSRQHQQSSSSPVKQTAPVKQSSNSKIRPQQQQQYQEPVNIVIDGVNSRAAKNGLAFEIDLTESVGTNSQKPKKHAPHNLSTNKSAASIGTDGSSSSSSSGGNSSEASSNNNDRKTRGWGKPVTDLGVGAGNKKAAAAVTPTAAISNGGESTPGSHVSDTSSDSLEQQTQTPLRSQSTPELTPSVYKSPPPPFHTDLPIYEDDTEEENLYIQKIKENTEKQNQEILRAQEQFKQRREKRMNLLKAKYQQQYPNANVNANANQPAAQSQAQSSNNDRIDNHAAAVSTDSVAVSTAVGETTPGKAPVTTNASNHSSSKSPPPAVAASNGSTRVSSTASAADVDVSLEPISPIDSRAVILPSMQKQSSSVSNSARKGSNGMSDNINNMLGRVAEAVQVVQNAVNTTPTRATPHKDRADEVAAVVAVDGSKPSSATTSSRRKLSEETSTSGANGGSSHAHKPVTKIVEKLSIDLALDEKLNKQLSLELEREDVLDQWFSKAKPASARTRHAHATGGTGAGGGLAQGSSSSNAQSARGLPDKVTAGIASSAAVAASASSSSQVTKQGSHSTPLKRQHSSAATGGDISFVSTAGSDVFDGGGDQDDAFIAGLQCALAAELMSDD